MSDLISREALMRRIQSEGKHQASQNANRYDPIVLAYGDCYAMAKTAPAVNAVEVVFCKDCIYQKDAKVNCKGFIICPASNMEITDDDYCSYGERIESEVSK